MRIQKEIVSKREETVLAAFRANPQLAIRDINEQLFAQYGYRMNLNRVYRLRKQVLEAANTGNA